MNHFSHEFLQCRFKCGSCYNGFSSKNALLKHESKSHPDAKFACDLCAQRFVTKKNISTHIHNVHGLEKPENVVVRSSLFKCGACKKIVSSRNALERHKRFVHLANYEFLCEHCSAVFRDKSALNKHICKHHIGKVIIDEAFKCSICGKSFSNSCSKEEHENACRLKRQEAYNRKLDKHANFLLVPDLLGNSKTYSSKNSKSNCNIIKQEPEDDLEELVDVMSFQLKEEPIHEDPIGAVIKIESDVIELADSEGEEISIKEELDDTKPLTFEQPSELSELEIIIKEEPIDIEPIKIMKLVTKIKCKYCSARFNTKDEFSSHFKSSHAKPKILLNNFGAQSNSDDSIKMIDTTVRRSRRSRTLPWNEFEKKLVEKLRCKICSQLFKTVSDKRDHVVKKHSIIAENEAAAKFHCSHCSMKFEQGWQLETHFKESHRKSDAKNVQQVIASSKEDFSAQSSFLLSTQVPDESIKTNATSFKITQPLLRESKKKNVTIKLKCKHCSQLFSTVCDMREHISKKHKITKEEVALKFHCSHCSMKFDKSWQLQEHFQGTHRKSNTKNVNQQVIENSLETDDEEIETEGEAPDFDEDKLRSMFKGETFNYYYKAFDCTLCRKIGAFDKLAGLKMHCVKVHRIKKIRCSYCTHSFNDPQKFIFHFERRHSSMTLKGSSIRRDYPIPNEDIECPHCSKILSQKESLRRHIELVHNTDRPKVFCDQCTESFIDRRTLQNHILKCHTEQLSVDEKPIVRRRATTQTYVCGECGDVVYGKTGLSVHRWVKHFNIKIVGKKKFHCLLCRQVMSCRMSALRHHAQVHKNGKLLKRKCQACNAEFQLFEDFKMHVESDHENAYICLVCGESLSSPVELFYHNKAHRIVPESEKKLFCDLCGFKAQQKITLELHMAKLHNGKRKEYLATCEYCGMTFNCYPAFYAHKKTHFAEKGEKFQCNYCEKTYYSMRNMRDHERSHTHHEGE